MRVNRKMVKNSQQTSVKGLARAAGADRFMNPRVVQMTTKDIKAGIQKGMNTAMRGK